MPAIAVDVKKKLESFTNLGHLALVGCELTTLQNFPNLPNLVNLELIDNKLTGASLKPLEDCVNLISLSLEGN